MKTAKTLVVLVALVTCVAAQRDKSQRPSQPGTAELSLNGKKITVDYSRPKIADPKTGQPRTIMGGIVPYGQVWRAGANEATTLKTEADLDVNGTTIPAGTYTLFTIPDQDKWTLIVSKKTGEWGIPYPGEQYDLARIPMNKVEHLEATVDPFTIQLYPPGGTSAGSGATGGAAPARLCLEWETTRSCVNVNTK